MTYKQATTLGAQVRKGEKSVMCVYFEMTKKKGSDATQSADTEQTGGAGKGEFFPMCKPFWLFNVAQMDGLPDSINGSEEPNTPCNTIDAAQNLLEASGVPIYHGFDGAFYSPGKDQICLPNRERFTSSESYFATALHELTHATGHESRLNRQFSKRFGDDAYAFKELVAELGAAFLVGHVGFVDATLEHHAAYLDSWLKVLKEDKTAIFTASKQASLAYDFILAQASNTKTKEVRAQ